MKTKKKQTKMVGRSALMASLIVAAITGVTPAFAANPDNISSGSGPVEVSAQTRYLKTTNVTIGGLTVTGTDTTTNQGKLYIGKNTTNDGSVISQPNSTLTADNMTITANGLVEVSNNSTLKIVQNKALVEGTLTLNDGTVDIANGTGTLQVAGGAGLLQTVTDSDNTVKGSVWLGANTDLSASTGKGTLDVVADSNLTITENLTVTAGSLAKVDGTLNVGGATKSVDAANGNVGINIGNKGMLVINNDSAVTTVATDTNGSATGVTLPNGDLNKVGNNSEGTLILRVDGNFKYTADYLTALATQLGMKAGGNVGILGGTWVKADGTIETPESDGTGTITAPSNTVKVTTGTVSGNILASSLDTTSATLTNTGDIILVGGQNGGNLISGLATEIANNLGGTLTLGIEGEKTSGTLNTKITNAGNLDIDGGSFVIKEVVNATDGVISGTNSSTVIENFTGNGGTLFADPAFIGINNVDTKAAFGTTIAVGEGGNISIGGSEGWLNTAIVKAGLNPLDPTTSVLGMRQTLTLAANTFVILDPTMTDAPTAPTGAAVQLGENSLFVADMSALTNGTALILNGAAGAVDKSGTVAIDPTATLYLDKLTYKNNNNILFKDNTVGGGNSAAMDGKFDSILNPDRMLNASFDTAGSSKLTVKVNNASDVLPGMSSDMNGLMGEVWGESLNSVNSGNAGIKMVSRAANSDYMTAAEGARVIEGAARMAVVGATQQMAFAASNAATSAATQRTSMANPMANSSGTLTALVREEGSQQWKAENSGLSAGNGMKNGAALWIMPLYQNMNAWNMKADNFNTGYSANFGGVALGGDYTFADAFRVGLALNIGGGFAESNGDFAKTENKFNFWGINLYGGWAQNNMAVTADVGYTSTFNDVKQDTPLNLGMSEFKTDMYSYAITAGLRGEYKVQTEYVDIIPHIAARFTSLHSDDYKIKSGGETVFKGEAIDQSIWTFPIGVAFSKDVEMSSGWTFKPQLDLAIIPAAGDIAAKSKVKIPGNSVTADLESNIVDGFSYQGALGFDMYKDNIAFGLNYTIQASEHTTGHGVQATIRYEF